MEEERPGSGPYGAAAGPGPLPKPTKLGLPGAGSEAEALAAEHTGGGNVLLRPLYHHPSNSANVKLGSGGGGVSSGGGIPSSPMALKSLPSPLRRTLRSYPSAAAILQGPGGPPGGAGADIFSRGRDALLLQQQQRHQQRHQQQREEERPGSLPASPSRPGSGANSPPVVVAGMTMAHPAAAGASPVLATALGPRLSRHAPLPSFSPRQGPKAPPASPARPSDAGARLPLPMPSPLPALGPVASTRPATPPSKLPATRQAPSGSGSSPQQRPSSGRPPSPLQRSKTMPSSRSSSTSSSSSFSSSVPSSPMPTMVRTQSTGGGGSGRRRSDSLPSSPTATPVVVTSGAATAETVPIVRSAGGKKKVKKVAFEQQPAAPPTPPPPPRSRSGSVSSVASSASEGEGLEPAPSNTRFARQQAPNAQGANKAAACDLSRLPEDRRERLLGMLRRLRADLQEEEEESEGSEAPPVVPEEVAALHRRIHDAGRTAMAQEEEAQHASSSGPSSPLLLGPAALRTQVQRDFGVKPTRGEAAALARYLAGRADGGAQGLGDGGEEPVLDYICVRRFLLQAPGDDAAKAEEPMSPPLLLKRRSILQEEAAKSELAFVPRDAALRALLEKMGEAASWLDRHRCDARVRPRGDGAATTTVTVPAKVSIEELEALAREALGLQLEAAELQLVVRWFGNHGLSLEGGEETDEGVDKHQQQGSSLVDYDLFLQHFWALGAAAKRMRRKEEAQASFLRVLATVGTGAGDEGAASG